MIPSATVAGAVPAAEMVSGVVLDPGACYTNVAGRRGGSVG
jgi:hypothetical protein